MTVDGGCSHEIQRCLLHGRKTMTNLDSIFLKSRDITLPTKVHLVKAMAFPVVMYGCESWTIKKVERGRIDAFELWWWRRLLRVPWTARRSNQSILKDIHPSNEYSGLIPLDWLDLPAVQGTLRSLLHHHSSQTSILRLSAFFIVQLSQPYMTTGKNHSFDQTDLCRQSNVSAF